MDLLLLKLFIRFKGRVATGRMSNFRGWRIFAYILFVERKLYFISLQQCNVQFEWKEWSFHVHIWTRSTFWPRICAANVIYLMWHSSDRQKIVSNFNRNIGCHQNIRKDYILKWPADKIWYRFSFFCLHSFPSTSKIQCSLAQSPAELNNIAFICVHAENETSLVVWFICLITIHHTECKHAEKRELNPKLLIFKLKRKTYHSSFIWHDVCPLQDDKQPMMELVFVWRPWPFQKTWISLIAPTFVILEIKEIMRGRMNLIISFSTWNNNT